MTPEQAAALREPFPSEQIGKLPRVTCKACRDSRSKVCEKHSKIDCAGCGNWITSAHIHLDYVGHAEATDRLLAVDPEWTWEPVAFDDLGAPLIQRDGHEARMWIRLTVCGVTRPGVGIVEANKFELEKQLISDAIRNAAMRFGVALDLWAKSELHPEVDPPLPPAEPMASKADIDLLRSCVDELPDADRTAFLRWKDEQDFAWPWTQAALDVMEAKLEEITGAGVPQKQGEPGTAAAPASESADGSGEPGSEPGIDETTASTASPLSSVPDELLDFSGEAF